LTEEEFARESRQAEPMAMPQLAQYQQSVLLALEDVENALVSYEWSQGPDVQLRLAAKDSKLAADHAYRDSSILDETRVRFSEKPDFRKPQSQSLTVSYV
jgi:hypothetical protein